MKPRNFPERRRQRNGKTRNAPEVVPNTSPVIEKGIPIPPARGSGVVATLKSMKINDSAWFDTISMAGSITYVTNRYHFKFTRRTEVRDGVEGTRIWRIA